MKHQIFCAALGFLVLVMNPTMGCSPSADDEYRFSEADMRAAVAGTYVGTYNGTSETVTLTLVEGTNGGSSTTQSMSPRQLQCARTFSLVKPASACIPSTTMRISGQISSSSGSIAASAVSGTFEVHSLDLTSGGINLVLTDGSTLSSDYEPSGFGIWQLTPKSGTYVLLDLVQQ